MTWKDYASIAAAKHTAVGNIQIWQGLHSPQLANQRDILVYLPPSYAEGGTGRYPVLYMHDGQNIFDDLTSYVGEWCVDETMEQLSAEGLEAIVVGVPNMGSQRLNEYSPFRDPRHGGGKGDAYLDFLLSTVKPLVDSSFRTRPSRLYTGLMGSSMGGLISLYGFFRHPDEFGLCGAMSPSVWFARGTVYHYIERQPPILGKIYMDVGTAEGQRATDPPVLRTMLQLSGTRSEALYDLLCEKGYREGRDILFIAEEGGQHTEAAWARRLPGALRFLLGDLM
jgi:predicted alpha/beta superfamily hydrolase